MDEYQKQKLARKLYGSEVSVKSSAVAHTGAEVLPGERGIVSSIRFSGEVLYIVVKDAASQNKTACYRIGDVSFQ